MEVTEPGIVTEVKPKHHPNTYFPIEATELGIDVLSQAAINVLLLVWMIALQFSRESYTVFPDSTMYCCI